MSKDILDYYERELGYLKREGAQFAEAYPGIASHLRITEDNVEDPHVSRLLEGVAFLNAKIHQRLDEDFNELSDAVLNQLYPHYQDPVPSFSVVQFVSKPEQAAAIQIASGCQLETRNAEGELLNFTTLQAVVMEPFYPAVVQMQPRPFNAPGSHLLPQAVSHLKIQLQAYRDEFSFQQLPHDKIRLFVRAPFRLAASLIELLGRNCVGIIASRHDQDIQPILLPPTTIHLCGYDEADSLLPYRKNAQIGYRALSEFFLFPEKFLFFELDIATLKPYFESPCLQLNIYFNSHSPELERQLNAESLALNCTPIINLFKDISEPIRLDHTQFEYQLQPSISYPKTTEIIQIESVEAVTHDSNQSYPVQAFFGLNHDRACQAAPSIFWHSRRKMTPHHSQLMLSFTDLEMSSLEHTQFTLYAHVLCSNGNLPETLPFGGGQPHFYGNELTIPLQEIRCVVAPTASLRQANEKAARWRVISHLNLNLLSLNNSSHALSALKEILRLYDFFDAASTRAMINALLRLSIQPCSAAVQFGMHICMARGLDIELEVDEAGFAGSNLFLFGQVLQQFFALHCSINSFTRLTLKVQGKEGIYHQWKPQIGARSLL